MFPKQTQKRLIVKTIIYRVLGLLITFSISYIFIKDFTKSIFSSILIEFTQTIVYYLYEMYWNTIEWGYKKN